MRKARVSLGLILICTCFAATSVAPVCQQVRQDWAARYNGLLNGSDVAASVAVDNQGNVYVTGNTQRVGIFAEDITTIKYDASGRELWIAHFDGPRHELDYGTAVHIDRAGNVYVGGTVTGPDANFYDYVVLKYDSEGNLLWVAYYDGGVNGNDLLTDMAVDAEGNIYVTGYSWSRTLNTAHYDYATVKFDANGNQLWVARYDGPGGWHDRAVALARDDRGNVYVTGNSDPDNNEFNSNNDYATIKYDREGNQVWVARYTASTTSDDRPSALGIDPLGNVYVTGASTNPARTRLRYATVKYDPDGNELWRAYYQGPGTSNDIANALAVDSQGNVYVTGMSDGGIATGVDFATLKYDSEGNELWLQRYNGPANSHDNARAIALDRQGNLYVAGNSRGVSTNADYAVIKYDPEGNLLWTARYNGPDNRDDIPGALTVDERNRVYITGYSRGATTSLDYATVKYLQIPAGDVDQDGWVDDKDLRAILRAFGQSGGNLPEDLNRDGTVDNSDLAILLPNFGQGC